MPSTYRALEALFERGGTTNLENAQLIAAIQAENAYLVSLRAARELLRFVQDMVKAMIAKAGEKHIQKAVEFVQCADQYSQRLEATIANPYNPPRDLQRLSSRFLSLRNPSLDRVTNLWALTSVKLIVLQASKQFWSTTDENWNAISERIIERVRGGEESLVANPPTFAVKFDKSIEEIHEEVHAVLRELQSSTPKALCEVEDIAVTLEIIVARVPFTISIVEKAGVGEQHMVS